jgi:hypothetical protein
LQWRGEEERIREKAEDRTLNGTVIETKVAKARGKKK